MYHRDRTSNGLLKGIDFTIEPEIGAANHAFNLAIHYAFDVPGLGSLISLLIWMFIMLLMSLSECSFGAFKYTEEYRTADANPQNSRADPLQLL